jgi:hypothetical protein
MTTLLTILVAATLFFAVKALSLRAIDADTVLDAEEDR